MKRPIVTVIAGPNGAGKTSLQSLLRQASLVNCNVLNIDALAIDLDTIPNDPLRYPIELAKRTDKKFKELCERAILERIDFAFECNLREEQVKYLSLFDEAGYEINLVYLWLDKIEISFNRVNYRVSKGGHYVGKESIIRNYNEGLKNLDKYFDNWNNVYVIDNSMVITELNEKANLPLILYIHDGNILYVSNEISEETLESNFPSIFNAWKKD
jgi:predicted ABC-type ATPase